MIRPLMEYTSATAAVRCAVCRTEFSLPNVWDFESIRDGHVVLLGVLFECPAGHEGAYDSEDVMARER